MRIRLLSDQPIENAAEDALGFAPFVESFGRELANAETPFVYGLLGEWGAGRTSTLRLLDAHLKHEREAGAGTLVPIVFNARQYENRVNLIYPLLYAVRTAYQSDRRLTALAGARGFGGMFARVAAISALASTDHALRAATKNLAADTTPLKDLRDQLEAVRQQPDQLEGILRGWADTVTQFRGGFEALLGTYASDLARADTRLKVEDVRFAILVDDLDRCSHETMLATLEATRYFLSARRAVFVVALNARVVADAFSRKLGLYAGEGREVLDGILHATIRLPEPAPEQVRQFARQRLDQVVLDGDPALTDALGQACDDCGQALADCRVTNPRQIKRILNTFLRFLDRYSPVLEQFSIPNIARLLALAEIEPGLFQAVLADPERVIAELRNVGTPEFSLPAFEQARGVSARASSARLSSMSKLFQFDADANKPGLRQQLDAVDFVTRWQ